MFGGAFKEWRIGEILKIQNLYNDLDEVMLTHPQQRRDVRNSKNGGSIRRKDVNGGSHRFL